MCDVSCILQDQLKPLEVEVMKIEEYVADINRELKCTRSSAVLHLVLAKSMIFIPPTVISLGIVVQFFLSYLHNAPSCVDLRTREERMRLTNGTLCS